jgi:hypothetical protein
MIRKIMKASILFSMLVFFYDTSTNAQGIYEAWVAEYSEDPCLSTEGKCIAVDKDANVYVAGVSFTYSTSEDILLIKYSPLGDTLWVRKYNGGYTYSQEFPRDMILDPQGNVYITGATLGTGTNGWDYVTIKYSPDGDTLWARKYNGLGNSRDFPIAMDIDDSGNIYVTGGGGQSQYSFDYATIKYTPSGDTVWARRYKGPGDSSDYATDIVVDKNGNVYVTGISWTADTINGYGGSYYFATLKYSSTGELLWENRLGPTCAYLEQTGGSAKIAIDSDTNVIISGSPSYSWCLPVHVTTKYSPSGQTIWSKRFDGFAYEIGTDSQSNVLVVGPARKGDSVYTDFIIVKLSKDGDSLWTSKFNDPINANVYGSLSCVEIDGNTYVSGSIHDSVATYDVATAKFSPIGNLEWEITYDKTDYDYPKDLTIDTAGNVYITGGSQVCGQIPSLFVIKYSPVITDVKGTKQRIVPTSWSLSQNYPNPFNPSTNIRFNLPTSGHVTLEIFNILGQKVKTLVDENLSAGYQQIIWDGTDQSGNKVASGIYFYRLLTKDFSQTKKMVFFK